MDKESTIEFAKEIDVVCTGVEVEINTQNIQEVRRVRFVTDKGNVTWKPKMSQENFKDGIKFLSRIPLLVDDLPGKIKDIAKIIQEKGKLAMTISYSIMSTTNAENEPVQYRFITSEKTFNDWVLKPEEIIKEEKVE